MKYAFVPHFSRSYRKFPLNIRHKFDKQLKQLLEDIKHPSLRAKKFDEASGIWQARVDRNIRFYFLIRENTYILLEIKTHAK